jgi:hypothetical protein
VSAPACTLANVRAAGNKNGSSMQVTVSHSEVLLDARSFRDSEGGRWEGTSIPADGTMVMFVAMRRCARGGAAGLRCRFVVAALQPFLRWARCNLRLHALAHPAIVQYQRHRPISYSGKSDIGRTVISR